MLHEKQIFDVSEEEKLFFIFLLGGGVKPSGTMSAIRHLSLSLLTSSSNITVARAALLCRGYVDQIPHVLRREKIIKDDLS
jgi:hypothetical protein